MEKINFQDLPSEETPINANNLNQMQDNIEKGIHLAVYSGGAIDPNTTLEYLILTRHANVPKEGSFYYIQTFFYESISTESNRCQIAIGYNTLETFQRYYSNGVWSNWEPILHDTGWQTPTLLNGWKNYGESFSTIQYRKNGKQVTLKGLAKSGTVPSVIFQLPVGYRPAETLIISSVGNSDTLAEIRIEKSGYVTINKGSSTWTSLDGISFLVD